MPFITLTTFGHTSSVSTPEHVPRITKYSAGGGGHVSKPQWSARRAGFALLLWVVVIYRAKDPKWELRNDMAHLMTKMLSELLWPVYFATLWCGTHLTKSRWLIKSHLVSGVWERSFISRPQGVQGPTVSSVMLHDSNPRPPQGRTLWQGEGAVFHPVHVLHVICCNCWRHRERWVVHHFSSLSLAFALRHLI